MAELDAMLRLLLEMLVVADLGVEDVRIQPGKRVLSADEVAAHPLLAGLDLPTGLVAPLAAILGSPYDHARRVAERAEARTVKKAASVQAAERIVDDLPEGTLLGRFDRLDYGGPGEMDAISVLVANKTKFGIVRMRKSPDGGVAPRRVIAPVNGIDKERPLDPARLARMPVITDPLAMREMQDYFAGGSIRDHVEAAFRFSLRLDAGERNPLLGTGGQVQHHAAEEFALRHTSIPGTAGTWVEAFAVTDTAASRFASLFTGVGFIVTAHKGAAEYYLRPARVAGKSVYPDEHRSIIEAGIREHIPKHAAAALDALDMLWSRGPDDPDCTCSSIAAD